MNPAVWIARLAPDAFGWALLAVAAVVVWLGMSVAITYTAASQEREDVDFDDPWEWAPAIVTTLLWPIIALAMLVSFPWRIALRRGDRRRRSRREAADL